MDTKAVLQLCRIPNVFTAISNVLAGVVLARGASPMLCDVRVLAASALLYLSGMVLNDYFDREVDAVERPERPIPSGRVSAGFALGLGLSLMLAALVLVAPLGHLVLGMAGALALAILAYDAWLKSTPMGVVSMGLCRSLNVMLGFAVVPWPASWIFVLPVGLGLYTAVITYLARDEVVGLALERSVAAARMMSLLFVIFVAFLTVLAPSEELGPFVLTAPFLVFLGLQGAKLFGPLMRDSSGPTVGRAIGGGILLMPAIDAVVVASAGAWPWALVMLALMVPALKLKRWYYLT